VRELIAKCPQFWRWINPDLILQPPSKIRIALNRLGQIAASSQGGHQIPITTLTQGLALNESACRALRRDHLVSTETQPSGSDALECSQLDVVQPTPLDVDPQSTGPWQERASGGVQGYACRRPRRRPVTTRNGRFGSMDRFGGRFDIYECIAP
jgi:hypothetical protein